MLCKLAKIMLAYDINFNNNDHAAQKKINFGYI